jgi:hypothetical protein
VEVEDRGRVIVGHGDVLDVEAPRGQHGPHPTRNGARGPGSGPHLAHLDDDDEEPTDDVPWT